MSQRDRLSRFWNGAVVGRVVAIALTVVVGLFALPPSHSAAAGKESGLHIYLQQGRDLTVSYAGSSDVSQLLNSGQAEPLSLTSGDFHGDGVSGLVVGYTTAAGYVLVVHEGNIDAIAPRGQKAWEAVRDGNYPSPFLPEAKTIVIPAQPDFLQAGNFNGHGQLDLVTAARGDNTLYVMAGQGEGQFASPSALTLPGKITAVAAGNFGVQGPFTSLLVGVSSGKGSSLLLFRGSRLGLVQIGSFTLPAAATQIALGDLNGDAVSDAAVVAGGEVLVLYSSPGNQKLSLEPTSLPGSVSAVALGRFVFDRHPQLQMALLGTDGSLHIAAHSGIDVRPWSAAEAHSMLQTRGRANALPSFPSSAQEPWIITETFAGIAPLTDPRHAPVLLRANVSSRGADDVVVVDGAAGQMMVVSHPNLKPGAASFGPGELSVLPYSNGLARTALTMRVNADARPGLVVLHAGKVAPSINNPLPDPTFTVNTTADTVDAKPGDGICADSAGNCSLRAAVMEANALLGNDTIMLPAGTFTLTIPNNLQYNATGGHLDINDGLTIMGSTDPTTGNPTTIIQAGTSTSNGIDKVFSIAAPPLTGGFGPSFATSFSNLIIQFGRNTDTNDPFGGAFDWDAGVHGNGTISITNCVVQNNSAVSTTTTQDDGGGMFFSNENGNTGTVTVSNSTIQGNTAQDAGGGLFVGGSVPLAMSNSQVLNNKAVGSGLQQGGGLAVIGPSGTTQSAVHKTTISGNQSGQQGGGIYATAGVFLDQGTVVSGNSSAAGGGLWSGNGPTLETTTVTNVTFTTNTASGNGGAIHVDGAGNVLNAGFNRIAGNTAAAGSGIDNPSGTVTATDNWWGCNSGPTVAPCDRLNGSANTSPFLVLRGSSNPTSVINGNATTLTASLLIDSQNNVIASSNLGSLAPIPVSWGSVSNGTLSNTQTAITSGAATTTFTSSASGTGKATATVDSASAVASAAITDFSVSITSSLTQSAVVNGSSAQYTVNVHSINGFCGTVNMGTIGFAQRGRGNLANTSFSPASVTISCSTFADQTSTLTVTTLSTTPVQGINFQATAASQTTPIQTRNSQQGTLTVTDFSLPITPTTAQQLVVGSNVNYTLTLNPIDGFTGTVTINSCTVSPAGAGVTLTGCPSSLNIPNSPTATLNLAATLSATLQTYTINVSGTANGSGDSHSGSATGAAVDFTVSITPGSSTIGATQSQPYTVTVTPLGGLTGPVNINCGVTPQVSGVPTFSTACPNSVTLNGAAVTFPAVLATTAATPGQIYSFTSTGTAQGQSRSGHATLGVQNFTISWSPTSQQVFLGNSVNYTLTVTPQGGFTGQVNINCGAAPSGPTVSCPSSLTVTSANPVSATVPVGTTTSITAQNYTLSATGTSASVTTLSQSATTTLVAQDFQLSISPPSQNVTVNGSVNYTVTATSLNGFSGSASLACGGSLAGADISCGNILIPGSTTLNVKTSGLTSPGNFQVFASSQGRSASAGIVVFDSRSWGIGGTVTCCSAGTGTFTLNVNGLSKTVTYCNPADAPILACEELGSGQPAVNNSATVIQALANAINGDSSSPATASIVNGALTLTAKTAGTFLRITSVDNGSPVGLVGGPSVYTLDKANLAIGGSADGGCCGGFSSTYTVFVSVNGGAPNFSESVGYCNPTNAPLPACQELGSSGVYSAAQIQQALANAFNADSSSPVTAAITNNGLTLTAKTAGTLLNVAGVDNGFDTATGVGFTASQVLNVPNSVGLLVQGNVSTTCCGAGFSTFTMTVNANGTNFSKSQSYCPPGTLPIPACKLPNGQAVEDVGTILQSVVNQFNSDSNSPVTAAINFGIVVLTAKTPGTVLTAGTTDDGSGMFSAEVGP